MCHISYLTVVIHLLQISTPSSWRVQSYICHPHRRICLVSCFSVLWVSKPFCGLTPFIYNSGHLAGLMSRPSAQNRAHERYESIRHSISRHTGTLYPCSSTDLRELTDPNGLLPYLGPRISVNDAARLLESQHSQPVHFKAYSALRHLRRLHELSRSDDWYPDLPFKIFGDIDDGLFGGELRAMIHMRWVTDEEIPDMAHFAVDQHASMSCPS